MPIENNVSSNSDISKIENDIIQDVLQNLYLGSYCRIFGADNLQELSEIIFSKNERMNFYRL